MRTSRQKFVVLCSVCSALCLTLIAQAEVFRGRVVDAANHHVANAEILVQADAAQTRKDAYRTQRSDAQGNFSVDLSAGFGGFYGRVTAFAPGMAAGGISLNQSTKSENNVIRLQPAQTVGGRLVDASGKPAANAGVLLQGYSLGRTLDSVFFVDSPWENRFQTTTDKNGHWQLKALPANARAYMIVKDARFVSQAFNVSSGTSSVITVRPGATLRGRVTNSAGKPVANIRVFAQGQGNNNGGANATSAKDGSYQLTGLSSGMYNIMVFVDDKSQVAKSIAGQAAHEGKTEKLRDLVLTPGAFISGQVVNLKTGKPASGVMIGGYGPQNPQSSAAAVSSTTDDSGKFQLRVYPGSNYVYVMGAVGFLPQVNQGKNVTVQAGQTAIQNFELDPGESVSGLVTDRSGKPLANVKIAALVKSPDGNSRYNMGDEYSARSDEQGNWRIAALPEGTLLISASGDWMSDAPVQVKLPQEGAVHIVAQKISALPPKGRVVDIHHRPLANISFQLQYETWDENTGSGWDTYGSATSDAKGNLRFSPQPTVTSVKINKINQPGYLLTSGGVWNVKTKTLSEIVLDRLNNTVQGRVINPRNEAASGVTVHAAAFSNAVAKTDKEGKFALGGLPHQTITLLAISGDLVAKSTAQSGATSTLRLRPLAPNHFPTRAQSLDRLEKIYRTTSDKTFWARGVIPYEIAQYDLQRGLNLLKDSSGKIPAPQFYSVLFLLKKKDPAHALQWGKDHLAGITKDDDRVQILCKLAKLAEPKNKVLAQKYFSEAAAIAQKFPAPQQKTYSSDEPTDTPIGKFLYSRVQLAGAAAVVSPAQTHQWVEEIFPYAVDPNRGTRGDYDWVRDTMAQSLGANAPQETQALIENSSGRAITTELKSAVEAAVFSKKPELAERWLDQFQQLYQQHKSQLPAWDGRYDFGQATRSVIELVGPKDPARALKLARLIDDQRQTAQSLMVAAIYQPKPIELVTLKAAFAMQSLISGENLARTAALIYDIDPAQGRGLFERLLRQYQTQNQDDDLYSSNWVNGEELAYFLARYKPAVSWMILQNAHAKSQFRTDKSSVDWGTLLAMSALNFDEAMQWTQQISRRDGFNYDAQRKLFQLALASPQTRRTLRLDRLGASDTWTPGEPTGW